MADNVQQPSGSFRPPAVPLVTCDPYFSVWSCSDRLTDETTRHWTGTPHGLSSLARIDGQSYRVMGADPRSLPVLEQAALEVWPTRTIYRFEGAGVRLTLTFMTPLLPADLDVAARPVSYVTWEVASADGRTHDVALHFEASAALAVNSPDQKVVWSRAKLGDLEVLRVGSQEQPILGRAGDNLRIDWGYLYLGAPASQNATLAIASEHSARHAFSQGGVLPANDDLRMPRRAQENRPVLAAAFELGAVGEKAVSRHLFVAYDDLYSIEYLGRRLRPYWRRSGWDTADLLQHAASDYEPLVERCEAFDTELWADLVQAGGAEYAQVCALAFRQCMAAHKLVADVDGAPLFFSKENFSNGCIATVDVTYPTAPFFLLFNTDLLKGCLRPILDYAKLPRWPFDFAPHDLGTYPLANGQVYGGGERTTDNQMPVEECGNMLLLAAALALVDGNTDFVEPYWDVLDTWAGYLEARGFDPENQLCTDDFAGHLAHNANLSLKAILALAAYAKLCGMAGRTKGQARYRQAAEGFAGKWLEAAADGDHYRLTFDQPGTWSQKYNLVWDKLLDLGVFGPETARQEIAYYLAKQNTYGLPLDNRSEYTKLDWIVWSATMAESDEDFRAFIRPIYAFCNDSPSRVPLTDWYWTHDAKQRGFQARSVVGGVFIKLLADPALWEKWRSR